MLFSIIVPVYNVKPYLERCLDSIVQQSFTDYELILVDDGSTDGSERICDEYQQKNRNIKVVHKANGGLSSARNVGIQQAKGEFIVFIDSDDWIIDNTLELFSNFIYRNKDNPADIYIGNILNEDHTLYSSTSRAEVGKPYVGKTYYVEFNESIIDCSVSSIYKRSFLLENGVCFPAGKLHEDYFFTPIAYFSAKTVVYTGIDFYIRFIREGSITQVKDKRKNLLDVLWISRQLLDYSSNIKDVYARRTLRTNVLNSYLSKFYDTDIYQYKEKNYKKYIDKKLVIICSNNPKNITKAALFVLSPRVYNFINERSKTLLSHIKQLYYNE